MPTINQRNIHGNLSKIEQFYKLAADCPPRSAIIVHCENCTSTTFATLFRELAHEVIGRPDRPKLVTFCKLLPETLQHCIDTFSCQQITRNTVRIYHRATVIEHQYEALFCHKKGLLWFKKTMELANNDLLLDEIDPKTVYRDYRGDSVPVLKLATPTDESKGFLVASPTPDIIRGFVLLKLGGIVPQAVVFQNYALKDVPLDLSPDVTFIQDGADVVLLD